MSMPRRSGRYSLNPETSTRPEAADQPNQEGRTEGRRKYSEPPELYQIATAMVDAALNAFPHFAIYKGLNAWGKQRELPKPSNQAFHQWYRQHRLEEI
jgi:hypothetical protein